ncbi:MAG: Crp/Fnr family transcriptional regulator [Rhodocyclales bacterium]|nr:Crp/Fnr family transcriptional regulator [Rhodocyclales bacterium]
MTELLLKDDSPQIAIHPAIVFSSEPMLPAYFPAELREASSLIRLKAGEHLFSPDAPPLACYRVLKGRVALLRPAADGASMDVQHAGEGEWLVEPSPFDRTVTCSAIAERPAVVRAVPIRAFRATLRRDAEFANAWSRETAQRAKRLQLTVERLSLIRACDRILHYLATEGAGGGEVYLAFPLREWARRLGMTGETLSRVLADMEAEGNVVRIGRRGFRLP